MEHPKKTQSVFCVRNQIDKPIDEHLRCPYCFGRTHDVIEGGERRRFCDYDPQKDPVCFGFPEGTTRNLKG